MHCLIERALEQVRAGFRQRTKLLDDGLVVLDRARVIRLLELSVRQPEIGNRLVLREGQAFYRGLEGGLGFGHSALPPVTPAEVQLRFAEERAFRKLLY